MAAPDVKKPSLGVPGAPDIEAAKAAGEVAETASEAVGPPVPGAVVDAGRAQALSMAMLDAAAQLRRVETLALAAMAAALEKILAGETEAGGAALEAAEATLDRAVDRLSRIVALGDR